MSISAGAVWHLSDDYPHKGELRALAERYEATPGNDGVHLGEGVVATVEDMIGWRKKYQVANNRFGFWCQVNALVYDDFADLEGYFGESAPLLDFERQLVVWEDYFESKAEEERTGEPGAASLLDSQVLFEAQYGIANISNPFLFPSRPYLKSALGGLDSEVMDAASARTDAPPMPPAVVVIQLERAFEEGEEAATAVEDAVRAAAESYLAGTYDAVSAYESLRGRLGEWATRAYFEEHACDEVTKSAAVARLAIKKMTASENSIVEKIAERTSVSKSTPSHIDRARMEKLRKGSHSRP